MMQDLNPTTRTFPRTMDEAFPNTVKHEQYLTEQQAVFHDEKHSQAEFWVYIALAFSAGFLFHTFWG